jgi:hypothetical protein
MFVDPRWFIMYLLPDHLMTFSRVRQQYLLKITVERAKKALPKPPLL